MINTPWIDPLESDLIAKVLDPNTFAIVFLMHSSDDTFRIVSGSDIEAAHSPAPSEYTTNMVALSVDKVDVESFSSRGKLKTKSLPRLQIAVDSPFVDISNLAAQVIQAYGKYFEFV